MSQVKHRPGSSDHTLFIAIGAQRIHCGLMTGQHAGGQWIKDSVREVRIDSVDGIAGAVNALIAALQRLQGKLAPMFTRTSATQETALLAFGQVKVLVADAWLFVAGVPWSDHLKQPSTAQSYARAQLAAAGYELSTVDTARLDDAPFGQPRLTVAYPAELLAVLAQLAGIAGARLSSVLPLSVAAWAFAGLQPGSRSAALAVLDDGLVMLARGDGRRSARLSDVVVRTGPADGFVARPIMREQWQRMRLRDPGLAQLDCLPMLDLSVAGVSTGVSTSESENDIAPIELPPLPNALAVSPALHLAALSGSLRLSIDAIASAPVMTPSRWVAALVAVLVAGALIVQAWRADAYATVLATRLNAGQNFARPEARPTSWSREEIARVQAVNTAIRELNLPISAILRALQPPEDIRVAVLSVETTDANTNSAAAGQAAGVKIMAEARTGADMARYVAFVAERKPFTGAYLTRHEINESVPEHPYRFTVEALWNE